MQARKIESAVSFALQMETFEAEAIVSGLTHIEQGAPLTQIETTKLTELRDVLRDVFGSVRK